MDLALGDDMYGSFVEYQRRLLAVFETMPREYRFHVIETDAQVEDVCDDIKNRLRAAVRRRRQRMMAPPVECPLERAYTPPTSLS